MIKNPRPTTSIAELLKLVVIRKVIKFTQTINLDPDGVASPSFCLEAHLKDLSKGIIKIRIEASPHDDETLNLFELLFQRFMRREERRNRLFMGETKDKRD